MANLSHEQFAETVNTAGGATRGWKSHETPPSEGYMVSVPGHESMHPSPLTAEHVAEHQRTHEATGHEVYQGGWSDVHPDTGEPTAFLDVSTRHNTPWHETRDLAESRGQIGSFHLPTFETHYSYRQMPSPQSNEAWESKPDRPSNYERDSDAVPEMKQGGSLRGEPHSLEDVMRTIATGRMNRQGHGR